MLLQIQDMVNAGSTWLYKIKDMAIEYAPKILGAIILYIIGTWIINRLAGVLRRILRSKGFDNSLQTFLISVLRTTFLLLLFLAIVGLLGVPITGFAAILAGAGLAIGAALNGSLGNLAGGVMIMIYKPFKVGDIIDAQGQAGVVQEIGIFNTVILTPDNKTVILPNGGLSTGVITNFNAHGNLRVDLTIAIAISQDIDKARQVAIDAMKAVPQVLEDPGPEVHVLKVDVGAIELGIRPYTTQADYWAVYFGVSEAVKKAFDQHGIQLPVPTRININR